MKGLILNLEFIKKFKPRKITGILFYEAAKSLPVKLFLGQTMHVDHVGDCVDEVDCPTAAVTKFIIVKDIRNLFRSNTRNDLIIKSGRIKVRHRDVQIPLIIKR